MPLLPVCLPRNRVDKLTGRKLTVGSHSVTVLKKIGEGGSAFIYLAKTDASDSSSSQLSRSASGILAANSNSVSPDFHESHEQCSPAERGPGSSSRKSSSQYSNSDDNGDEDENIVDLDQAAMSAMAMSSTTSSYKRSQQPQNQHEMPTKASSKNPKRLLLPPKIPRRNSNGSSTSTNSKSSTLNRRIATKQIVVLKATSVGSPEKCRQAACEVDMLRLLSFHPNILRLVDCGFSALNSSILDAPSTNVAQTQASHLDFNLSSNRQVHYLVLEHCPGGSLMDLIMSRRSTFIQCTKNSSDDGTPTGAGVSPPKKNKSDGSRNMRGKTSKSTRSFTGGDMQSTPKLIQKSGDSGNSAATTGNIRGRLRKRISNGFPKPLLVGARKMMEGMGLRMSRSGSDADIRANSAKTEKEKGSPNKEDASVFSSSSQTRLLQYLELADILAIFRQIVDAVAYMHNRGDEFTTYSNTHMSGGAGWCSDTEPGAKDCRAIATSVETTRAWRRIQERSAVAGTNPPPPPPIIHRDLKPENILLMNDPPPPPPHQENEIAASEKLRTPSQNGSVRLKREDSNNISVQKRPSRLRRPLPKPTAEWDVKLCDFGSAIVGPVQLLSERDRQMAHDTIRRSTTQMYRAPEMVDLHMATELSEKTDIWALGCCLYTTCFLKNCFEENANLAILAGKYVIPSGHPYNDDIVELIRHMLNVDPQRRPNINEVFDCIEALQRGEPLPLLSLDPPKPLASESKEVTTNAIAKSVGRCLLDMIDKARLDDESLTPNRLNNPPRPPMMRKSKEAKELDPNSAAARRSQIAAMNKKSAAIKKNKDITFPSKKPSPVWLEDPPFSPTAVEKPADSKEMHPQATHKKPLLLSPNKSALAATSGAAWVSTTDPFEAAVPDTRPMVIEQSLSGDIDGDNDNDREQCITPIQNNFKLAKLPARRSAAHRLSEKSGGESHLMKGQKSFALLPKLGNKSTFDLHVTDNNEVECTPGNWIKFNAEAFQDDDENNDKRVKSPSSNSGEQISPVSVAATNLVSGTMYGDKQTGKPPLPPSSYSPCEKLGERETRGRDGRIIDSRDVKVVEYLKEICPNLFKF